MGRYLDLIRQQQEIGRDLHPRSDVPNGVDKSSIIKQLKRLRGDMSYMSFFSRIDIAEDDTATRESVEYDSEGTPLRGGGTNQNTIPILKKYDRHDQSHFSQL